MAPVLFVLFLCLSIATSYHISLSTFDWDQAEQYCVKHCNSHLGSIHSDQQYQQLIDLIKNITNDAILNISNSMDILIGLNDQRVSHQYEWSDDSTFDFGNDTTIRGGIYPWKQDAPTTNTDYCVAMLGDNNYRWTNVYCHDHTNIFVCNHCDGVLTKYAIIDKEYIHNEARAVCETVFGTELASIHSVRDFAETVKLCNLSNSQWSKQSQYDCYIGLQSNGTVYSWDDGTHFDFASNLTTYPWEVIPVQDTKHCVDIDENEGYLLSDANCIVHRYAICNMPSEICYKERWDVLSGDVPKWTLKPCEISWNYNGFGIAIISDRIWLNNPNRGLLIEYIYSIEQIFADAGTAGVAINYHMNTICNHYYYIGISKTNNSVFFAEIINQEIKILHSEQLYFQYILQQYYLLRIHIINGTTYMISVNDANYLNITHNAFNNDGNEQSGIIGILNVNSSIIAKSLFISGRIQPTPNINSTTWLYPCPTSTATTTSSTIDIQTTTLTSSVPKTHGISIKIDFEYDTKILNINITNILINMTRSVIEKQIQNASVCVASQAYSINVRLNSSNEQTHATITALVDGCDSDDQQQLIVIFDQQLAKSFIDKSADEIAIYVHPDTVNIDVYVIDESEVITTTIGTTQSRTETAAISKDDSLIVIIIGLIAVMGICGMVGIVVLYKHTHKAAEKELIRNMSANNDVEMAPDIGHSNVTMNHSDGELNTKYTSSNNGATDEGHNVLDLNLSISDEHNHDVKDSIDALYAVSGEVATTKDTPNLGADQTITGTDIGQENGDV